MKTKNKKKKKKLRTSRDGDLSSVVITDPDPAITPTSVVANECLVRVTVMNSLNADKVLAEAYGDGDPTPACPGHELTQVGQTDVWEGNVEPPCDEVEPYPEFNIIVKAYVETSEGEEEVGSDQAGPYEGKCEDTQLVLSRLQRDLTTLTWSIQNGKTLKKEHKKNRNKKK